MQSTLSYFYSVKNFVDTIWNFYQTTYTEKNLIHEESFIYE